MVNMKAEVYNSTLGNNLVIYFKELHNTAIEGILALLIDSFPIAAAAGIVLTMHN